MKRCLWRDNYLKMNVYIQKKVKPLMNVIIRDFVPTSSSLWCFFFLESPSKSISSTSSSYSKWHFFHRVCASKNPNPFLSGSEGKYIGILLLNTLRTFLIQNIISELCSESYLTEYCWVLLSFAKSFWVLLSLAESCWVLLSLNELCWVWLSLAEF